MYGYPGLSALMVGRSVQPFDSDLLPEPSASQGEQGGVKTPFGVAREVPLQRFFDSLLPQLRHGLDPEQVLEAIKTSIMSSSYLTTQGRWRGFAKDPAHSQHSARRAFSHLEGVVKAVVRACSSSSGAASPVLIFKSNVTPITTFQERTTGTLPDVFFLADDSEPTPKTIAVCGEYQKEDSLDCVEDNIGKVTGSMANCIRQDPRRRFVFGFTVENTNMRLWHCDRGSIVASYPFNFITDHLSLIHFLVSILYADPHQLGWDNTMTPLADGLNFDITVHSHGQDRTYRTEKLLFDRGSRILLGKATRVWKAVRLEDEAEIGPPVALKDCWVDPARTREGDILRRIRHDILTESPEDEDLVERLLPVIEWDGNVLIGDGETLDVTYSVAESQHSNPSIINQESRDEPQEREAVLKDNLVHYRLVVSPASERSVEQETSAPMIYSTLAHAAGALQLMHKAGWVHRDISTGNITLDAKRARLVDFEFSKQASDEDDLSIGTTFFQAFEVAKQSYVFRPPPVLSLMRPPNKGRNAYRAPNDDSSEVPQPAVSEESPPDPPRTTQTESNDLLNVPVRYNPLHDLESLWWVALYFLLKREPRQDPESSGMNHVDGRHREQQRAYADRVFSERDTRAGIMVLSNFYIDAAEVLHPIMHPALGILCRLQQSLVERYTEVEKHSRSIPFSCAEGLHETFITALFEIAELDQLDNITLHPLPPPSPLPLLGAVVAAPQVLVPELEDQKEDIPVQAGKEDTIHTQARKGESKKSGKGEKTRRRRKPSATAAPVQHRYNLRPRPNRD